MNKFKNNIFLYIIIAISIFAIATGVYSATSVKQGVSGSISYEAPAKISQLASTWNSDEAGKGGLFDSNVSPLTKHSIYSITFTQDSSLLTSDYGEPLALNLAETGTQKNMSIKK